jgi:hypothetical protein
MSFLREAHNYSQPLAGLDFVADAEVAQVGAVVAIEVVLVAVVTPHPKILISACRS